MEKSESKYLIYIAEPVTGSYESVEKLVSPQDVKREESRGCEHQRAVLSKRKRRPTPALRATPPGRGQNTEQSDEGLIRKHQMSSLILSTDLGLDVFREFDFSVCGEFLLVYGWTEKILFRLEHFRLTLALSKIPHP
jgi:hypothetical protein